MQLKSLLIIPVLAPLFLANAQAIIPDEINYSPYKTEYDQLAIEVDYITTNLNQAKQDLQYAYNQEASIILQIQNIENENQDVQNSIANLESKRQDLLQRSDELADEMEKLNRRINQLERERNQIDRDMLQEERRLAPMQERVARLENKLLKKNVEVNNARKNYQRVARRSENFRAQLEQLKLERKAIKSQLVSFRQQLKTIDGKLASEQSKLDTIAPRLVTARAHLQTEKAKVAPIKAELVALRAKLTELMGTDRANPEVRVLRKKVAEKSKEVKAQERVVQQAKKQVNSLKSTKNNLVASLKNLNAQKKTLPAKIKQTQSNLQTKIALIQTKKGEVANAETVTAKRRAIVDTLAVEANGIQNRLRKVRRRLIAESATLNQLVIELENTDRVISNVTTQINNRSRDYQKITNQISEIDRSLPSLRGTIGNNITELKRLDNDLATTQENIQVTDAAVIQLETEQALATNNRDSKYDEYISRYNYYSEKLSEAKTLGESQTGVALNLARINSNIYVEERAKELGIKIGNQMAMAQSNLWAAVRSEIKGYAEGYATGYASETDQSRGEDEGSQAGTAEAIDYATNILKPQFFNNIFAEKIESAQLRIKKILESGTKLFSRVETQRSELVYDNNIVSPITSQELDEALNLTTGLDQMISTFRTNLQQATEEESNMNNTDNTYQGPTMIPYRTYDCRNVYEGVQEFQEACKKQYFSVFETKYRDEYYKVYDSRYNDLYTNNVSEQRDSVIEALYESDLVRFYPIAEDTGITDGKAAIYQETYAQAKVNAYNSELPSATNRANETAGIEVSKWISENATLTLKGASILGSDLQGGTKARISIKIKNISPKELTKPVKVLITSASNASVDSSTYLVKSAGANTVTNFNDIQFRVNPNTRSNQKIVIKGKIILAGGKYNAQRYETFTATGITSLNPSLTDTYKYDATPAVITTFRRRTILHSFDATISPRIENISAGYTVKISAVAGYEGMIKFNSTSINTGRVNFGNEKRVRFQYTFPRSSEDKLVKIKIDYLYKSKTIKTKTIELRPH